MSGTRGVGRLVAMVLALVVVAFLLLAGQARAGLYTVAQCGWGGGGALDPAVAPLNGLRRRRSVLGRRAPGRLLGGDRARSRRRLPRPRLQLLGGRAGRRR